MTNVVQLVNETESRRRCWSLGSPGSCLLLYGGHTHLKNLATTSITREHRERIPKIKNECLLHGKKVPWKISFPFFFCQHILLTLLSTEQHLIITHLVMIQQDYFIKSTFGRKHLEPWSTIRTKNKSFEADQSHNKRNKNYK